MPRLLKRGILGASTIILSKDIDKYAFMCGSNFYETDVRSCELTVLYTVGQGVCRPRGTQTEPTDPPKGRFR